MTNLDDIRDYIQGNLTRVLAIGLAVLSGMGVTAFAITNVLPEWRLHNELAAQVVSAQDMLQSQQDAGLTAGDAMRRQADLITTRVAEQALVLLTEKEAAQVLANVYGYASDAGTQVTDLQAQPTPKSDTKSAATMVAPMPYTIRVFRLTVAGEADHLVDFLTRFREAALPGVSLSNLNISEDEAGTSTLVVDVTMYTSSYAPGNALESQAGEEPPPLPLPQIAAGAASPTPETAATTIATIDASAAGPTPTGAPPTPTGSLTQQGASAATETPAPTDETAPAVSVQSLLAELDTEWAAENWPAIITISQEILSIDPTTAGLSVKLYTAHTNYGYQLASQGKTEEAKAEFTAALSINPDGAAALTGLKMLSNESATPAPAVKVYVVQWGDTLANLAIHFNVSVQAIKAANHLLDDRIYAGQELIIPE